LAIPYRLYDFCAITRQTENVQTLETGQRVRRGEPGPWMKQGHVLRERRENLPDTPSSDRSQVAMARRMGISQAHLSRLEAGHENIANYNLDWFERNAPHYKWAVQEMLAALGVSFLKSNRTSDDLSPEALERAGFVTDLRDWVMVRVRDITATGNGLSADAHDFGAVAIPLSLARPGVEAVRVVGDGMSSGSAMDIADGDVVLVDTNDREPRDRRVYVVRIEGVGTVLKRARVYPDPVGMMLTSDNTTYPPFSLEDAVIVGRAVEVTRRRPI
jgi:SOS-response transcriptional repressor LexA